MGGVVSDECMTAAVDAASETVRRLMAMREKATGGAPLRSVRWPEMWGLEHIRLGSRTVSQVHRQARMLDAAPMDPEWLHCDRCHGTAAEYDDHGARACRQCSGLHQRLEMLARCSLPASAASHTLRTYNFRRPGVPSDLVARLEAVVRGEGIYKGLMLFGGVGVGKTHLAHGVVLEMCAELGRPARFVYWPDYLDRIRACFGSDTHHPEVVRATIAGSAGLLVIDDMGAEKATDWTREEATKLIDMRYREGRPVLVTTNLNPGGAAGTPMAMVDALGVRTHSRLYDMTDVVAMGGTDHRVAGQ